MNFNKTVCLLGIFRLCKISFQVKYLLYMHRHMQWSLRWNELTADRDTALKAQHDFIIFLCNHSNKARHYGKNIFVAVSCKEKCKEWLQWEEKGSITSDWWRSDGFVSLYMSCRGNEVQSSAVICEPARTRNEHERAFFFPLATRCCSCDVNGDL